MLRYSAAKTEIRRSNAPQNGAEGSRHGALRDDTMRDIACNTARQRTRWRSDMVGGSYDMACLGLRHGQARPTTRHSAHAGWAKGGCTVHSTRF